MAIVIVNTPGARRERENGYTPERYRVILAQVFLARVWLTIERLSDKSLLHLLATDTKPVFLTMAEYDNKLAVLINKYQKDN